MKLDQRDVHLLMSALSILKGLDRYADKQRHIQDLYSKLFDKAYIRQAKRRKINQQLINYP